MTDSGQPIIIKRVKRGGHGHHGGAWKVAFADFVTAMMAFFLLLWLLGSTTEDQRRGISDYFQNPSSESTVGGSSNAVIDMGGGMDIPSGKGEEPEELFPKDEAVVEGIDGEGKQTLEYEQDEKALEEQAKELERRKLESLMAELKQAIESGQELAPFKDQLLLDITSEGLRIQIVDKENRPMFDMGSAILKNYTQVILREIVKVINSVPNRISLSGHTDQTPFASNDGYTNWELSADRANAARRELVAGGLPEDKVGRVVGLGSSVLFDKQNAFNPINRRISIIVMNKAAEDELSRDAVGEAAVPPKADTPQAPSSAAKAPDAQPAATRDDASATKAG